MREKWKLLQSEQIELGIKAGLSQKDIRLYAKHCYDFLQMQEIRTALEEGLSREQVKRMCHSRLSHEEMEEMRKAMKQGEYVNRRPMIRYWILCAALLILCGALIAQGYVLAGRQIYLDLSQNEVILEEGEPFEPMKYVAGYSMDAERLRLPADNDTSVPGTQAAVYTLRKGKEELTRILRVTIAPAEEETAEQQE